MDETGRGILGEQDVTGEEIRRAMGFAINDALRRHKADGHPIAVWDDKANQAVLIPADQIVIPPDPEPIIRDNGVISHDAEELDPYLAASALKRQES